MTSQPLLSRDFVLLVAGQGISLFGNMMLRFAMSMWVLDETGSATIFASVLAVSIVSTILLSPFGGVLADGVNRRTIMVALDAVSAALECFIQLNTPEAMTGKVMSMAAAVSMRAQPLGQMAYGWAYDRMSVAAVLFISAALFGAITIMIMPLSKQFKD